jgi:hypothetical protein
MVHGLWSRVGLRRSIVYGLSSVIIAPRRLIDPPTNPVRRSPFLGRIIHTTNPTRLRNLAIKKMISAIREFLRSPQNDAGLFELGGALTVSLQEIWESVDHSAAAWEKRDYWLKSDAFRRQWSWVDKSLAGIKASVSSKKPASLQQQIIELGEKLGSLKIS